MPIIAESILAMRLWIGFLISQIRMLIAEMDKRNTQFSKFRTFRSTLLAARKLAVILNIMNTISKMNVGNAAYARASWV
jgi:hypothetical protein